MSRLNQDPWIQSIEFGLKNEFERMIFLCIQQGRKNKTSFTKELILLRNEISDDSEGKQHKYF